MKNIEKYNGAFIEIFGVGESSLNESLEYNTIPSWDSVGHMGLIAALEDGFEIEMDMEDIIEFSSYEKGKEILRKYDISV